MHTLLMPSVGSSMPTFGFALKISLKFFSLFINSSLKNFNCSYAFFISSCFTKISYFNNFIVSMSSGRDGLYSNNSSNSWYLNNIKFCFFFYGY